LGLGVFSPYRAVNTRSQLQQDGQCTYKRNNEAHSCKHCRSGKTMSITICVCVCVCVALVIQHAMHMRHIVICGLLCSTIFFHSISNCKIFGKKVIEHKMCFDLLYNICLKHFSLLGKSERNMIKMHIGLQVKYPLFLYHCNENLKFLDNFRKILKYQIS
jgi:hypothetical protein